MAIVLAATPAQAATGTVDGIRYSADADTGHATVADYDGTQGADVTIPAVVSIGGDDYSVTTIGAFAFSSNGLIDVAIPATVTSIGEWAFFANQLKKVTIPATVTSIGAWAFHFNDLERVTLAEGVTTIGAFAFHDNELESVTIPATVTAIGEWAYNENPDLIRVKFLGPAPEVVASTNELRSFDTASGSLTLHYVAKYGTPTAPDGFTTPTWNGYTTAPSATITGDPTAAGAVGTEFIYTPTVTGTPTPEVTTSSPLPDGLNLDASGVISGTPAESAGGEYPITLTASNTGGTSSHDVTVTINEAPTLGGSPPASELTVADSFDFTPNVSGFPAPAFDLSGSLPAGLFFHSSTGEVVG
ncbi:MAG: leucine-rich repeat protein, partial [Aeromicrobium sp.]|uniref:leucine-rich repeat protein n=1 Tax=Aeromicrobium sp. TaxID=1871063 RepID=UPI003C59F2B6